MDIIGIVEDGEKITVNVNKNHNNQKTKYEGGSNGRRKGSTNNSRSVKQGQQRQEISSVSFAC